MANKEMKTLNGYEIVDGKAREEIETLKHVILVSESFPDAISVDVAKSILIGENVDKTVIIENPTGDTSGIVCSRDYKDASEETGVVGKIWVLCETQIIGYTLSVFHTGGITSYRVSTLVDKIDFNKLYK
jgi:hypothetical protein